MTAAPPHLALYPGSFDPLTRGHLDVLARSRRLFDEIVVGIGDNPDKQALFATAERVEMARILVDEMLAETPDGAPVRVESYGGLTVDFARELGASAIVRGIRNATDLSSECQLAITNRQVADVETVFVLTAERYGFTSSSLIRQIWALGGDLARLEPIVPPLVLERLQETGRAAAERRAALVRDQNID